MTAHSPEQWKLSELNRDIGRFDVESKQLHAEQAVLAKVAKGAARRLLYLRIARRARSPTTSFALWPVGLLLVGPILFGGVLLVLVETLTGSLAYGLLVFLAGAAIGVIALASLLYSPADIVLPAAVDAAETENALAQSRLKDVIQRLSVVTIEYRKLVEERRDLMSSGQVQRAALLQRPWKTMNESEWEDFLVEVFRTLGTGVEREPRSGESESHLIAELNEQRIAVLVHGEGRTVNSRAVQQALAAKDQRHCDRCAVVVNRRFTGAAQDFARRHGCTLIGLDEFPDFVLGKSSV